MSSVIDYYDFLVNACDERNRAAYQTLFPFPDERQFTYQFDYQIIDGIDNLNAQASHFADLVLSLPNIRTKLSKTQSRSNSILTDKLIRSYKYSYFKVLYYTNRSRDLELFGFNSSHMNSIVYYGHGVLFYYLLHERMRVVSSTEKSVLYKTLSLPFPSLKSYLNDPVWIKSTNGPTGVFLDSELEDLISDISENYLSVKTIPMRHIPNEQMTQSLNCPLGNMCYNFSTSDLSLTEIYLLPLREMLYDTASRFWSLANNISYLSSSLPKTMTVPYISINTTEISNHIISYMVKSITGLSEYSLTGTDEGTDVGTGRGDTSPSGGGSLEPGYGNGGQNPPKPRNRRGQNPNNKQPLNKLKLSSDQSKVVNTAKLIVKSIYDIAGPAVTNTLSELASNSIKSSYNKKAYENVKNDLANILYNNQIKSKANDVRIGTSLGPVQGALEDRSKVYVVEQK